jgi:hypothetical protein
MAGDLNCLVHNHFRVASFICDTRMRVDHYNDQVDYPYTDVLFILHLMQNAFPQNSHSPSFRVLGGHESYLCNSFPNPQLPGILNVSNHCHHPHPMPNTNPYQSSLYTSIYLESHCHFSTASVE